MENKQIIGIYNNQVFVDDTIEVIVDHLTTTYECTLEDIDFYYLTPIRVDKTTTFKITYL